MGLFLVLGLLAASATPLQTDSFKTEQLRFPRVRQAYTDKEDVMETLLAAQGLQLSEVEVYLRGFKQEKELEVWVRERGGDVFSHLITYPWCRSSGQLGPKRRQGDLQIPEGFYHISLFNPASSYYLSLKVNYPNRADRILGGAHPLGGDIFVHGDCVTIGCIPLTDDKIKELYLLCVEARNGGQGTIPISLFPARLDERTFQRISQGQTEETIGLWTDLKAGYEAFNEGHKLPDISFLENGRHRVVLSD